MKRLFIFSVFSLCIFSCRQESNPVKTERSFYYWKSVFNPTQYEKNRLDSAGAKTIYLKFFDVEWNESTSQPVPAAKAVIIDTAWLKTKNIIPAIFITNETIYNADSTQIKNLSENISQLIIKYIQLYQIKNIVEIQIDCDWTASTKNKYFYFLQLIKEQNKNMEISATIRLHQLKYRNTTGIPPVERGLLMCYNMGNLQQINTRNSIIDADEFAKYISTINTYPMPLDIGLPLFEWYVLFRENTYAGLLQSLPEALLQSSALQKTNNGYILQKDTMINERLLKAGDYLRYESSDYKSILKIADQLKNKINNKNIKIAFYHCDSVILSKYSTYEIQNIYSSLH